MNAVEHLETYLGPMERGWSSNDTPGVQVCLFRDQPSQGVNTVATLGLSNALLELSDARRVRQELLLAAREGASPDDLGRILLHVARLLVQRGRAVLRGEVIPLGQEIEGGGCDALYASIPVVYPDGLSTLRDSEPACVIVWLVPIHRAEAAFVDASGWDAFEDVLEEANPDLFDLSRKGVIENRR